MIMNIAYLHQLVLVLVLVLVLALVLNAMLFRRKKGTG